LKRIWGVLAMTVCDGCGALVEADHIRARIERLELATRYRPVHIQTLLIGDRPPARAEDYFYASGKEGAELQRHGIFLVYAVECPIEDGANAGDAVRRAARSVVLRVQHSYKPKSIVLFSPAVAELIPALREAGLGERLILSDGAPFAELPDLGRIPNAGGLRARSERACGRG
jgi:hypothetical protein